MGEGGEAAALLSGVRSHEDRRHHAADGACAKTRRSISNRPGELARKRTRHYAEILKRLGYEHTSKGLICVGARGLGVSVHADAAVSLKPIASTHPSSRPPRSCPSSETGTMVPYDDLEVYAPRRLSGASVLVKNVGSQKTKVTVDVAKSRNCQSHTGALVASASLNPGEARVLHHRPPAGRGAWGFAYEAWKVLG